MYRLTRITCDKLWPRLSFGDAAPGHKDPSASMSRALFPDSATCLALGSGAAWMVSTSVTIKPPLQAYQEPLGSADIPVSSSSGPRCLQMPMAIDMDNGSSTSESLHQPRQPPACIAVLRVHGRLGQDATTRDGGQPRVILACHNPTSSPIFFPLLAALC